MLGMLVIPTPRGQSQEDILQVQPGLHSEYHMCCDYIVRPYLKKKKKKQNQNLPKIKCVSQ